MSAIQDDGETQSPSSAVTWYFVPVSEEKKVEALLQKKLGKESRHEELSTLSGAVRHAYASSRKDMVKVVAALKSRFDEMPCAIFREERPGFIREWDFLGQWWKQSYNRIETAGA